MLNEFHRFGGTYVKFCFLEQVSSMAVSYLRFCSYISDYFMFWINYCMLVMKFIAEYWLCAPIVVGFWEPLVNRTEER
jgi:hypothetical protein